jgi:hypothetical protein
MRSFQQKQAVAVIKVVIKVLENFIHLIFSARDYIMCYSRSNSKRELEVVAAVAAIAVVAVVTAGMHSC